MSKLLRFRSAVLFISLPALWLGSFTLSRQLDPTSLSGDFSYIPVSIHASQSADYSRDPASNKFAPVNEDILTDLVIADSPSPTITGPVQDRDDEEENSAPTQNSSGGGSDLGSSSTPGKGHGNGNAGGNGNGGNNGNAGGNGKGKDRK